MTTTCMRNSSIGDAWIAEACQLNPVTNLGNGTFLTGPVRLSFPVLFTPKAYTGPDGKTQAPKYSVSILFPPSANIAEMEACAVELAAAKWPESYAGGKLYGVPIPLRDQGERGNKEGYTPGLKFFNASAESKPLVYDRPPAQTLVTLPSKVYAGMWAICNVRFYAAKGAKRVAAGLNAVTLYADDTSLGGSGPDEAAIRQQMSGIRAAGPIAVPNMGAAPQAHAQPPMSEDEYLRAMGL